MSRLALAEEAAVDVLVTADQNLSYQQNRKERKLALVVLNTPNKTRVLANVARILGAVNEAEIGGYTFVDISPFRHRRIRRDASVIKAQAS